MPLPRALSTFASRAILIAALVLAPAGWARADVPEAVFAAALAGDAPRLEKLLRGGASPDVPSRTGVPPLVAAARGGHEDACRVLLAFGASVTQADLRGSTPIAAARRHGHAYIVGMLERQTGFAYGVVKLGHRRGSHRLAGGVLEIQPQPDGSLVQVFTKHGMGVSEAIMVARTLGGPGLDYDSQFYEPGLLSFPGSGGDGTYSPHVSAIIRMHGPRPWQVRVVVR